MLTSKAGNRIVGLMLGASVLVVASCDTTRLNNVTNTYAFAPEKIKLSPTEAVSTGHWDKPL